MRKKYLLTKGFSAIDIYIQLLPTLTATRPYPNFGPNARYGVAVPLTTAHAAVFNDF